MIALLTLAMFTSVATLRLATLLILAGIGNHTLLPLAILLVPSISLTVQGPFAIAMAAPPPPPLLVRMCVIIYTTRWVVKEMQMCFEFC